MLFDQDYMNTYLNQVKKLKKIAIMAITMVALIAASQVVHAQKVNITVNVLPPYSPYYSDYSGVNASKVLLILQNTTNNQVKVKLAGQLTGDNGIRIATYTNYIPLQPIILNAHETKQLNGLALKDIFDINNLSVAGIDKAKLAQTSRLPEGNYSFCLQAYDYDSKALLSSNAPLGCTNININYPEPPILIGPIDSTKRHATNPQTIVFNWTNTGTVPPGTQYTLQLTEMPDIKTDPNQLLNATSFPMLSQTVTGYSYVYNVLNLPLKQGKKYAWRVIAKDPSKRTLFKNNGISAAGIFAYGDNLVADKRPVDNGGKGRRKQNSGNIQISGVIKYQYRTYPYQLNQLPADFKGEKDEGLAIGAQKIQLVYGLCHVPMDLTPHFVKKVVANKALVDFKADGVTVTKRDNDSSYVSFYRVDTIPAYGNPVPYFNPEPAGAHSDDLGEVLAETTTSKSGAFEFNTDTKRASHIYEIYDDNTALVYCYYINIKNKHFTDPRTYAFINPLNDGGAVNMGTLSVFADTYNLTVNINRDKEFSTNKGADQNVNVENKQDDKVDVYVLRKKIVFMGADFTAPFVPKTEGDNTGGLIFASQALPKPAFSQLNDYEVVAKRTVLTTHESDLSNPNNFRAHANFFNLFFNLTSNEDYLVYAEYPGSSVYFDKNNYVLNPANGIPEYNPQDGPAISTNSMEITPAYISVRVKGVLKYQFKNGVPKPLANMSVSLQSLYWETAKHDDGTVYKKFDMAREDKTNHTFVTTTTDDQGYFDLNACQLNYNDYDVGNILFAGISQFITVNSPYYASPDDKPYYLQAGNTYNLGEIVASVKEYKFNAFVQGPDVNGKVVPLGGQKVYLMRATNVNPQLWGVPADEVSQQNLPVKQHSDIDGNVYNVVGYGVTTDAGHIVFNHLVAPDPNNSDDRYYLFSESGILSLFNYSTQYAADATLTKGFQLAWKNTYYTKNGFTFNSVVNNPQYKFLYSNTYDVTPLPPFIEGAVYPVGNSSTTALPDVKVDLYDVDKSFPFTDFETSVKSFGVEQTMKIFGPKQPLSRMVLQDSKNTPWNGLFNFDPTVGANTGWKLLVYSKPGFISFYSIVNGGDPMGPGRKESVKGFLYPPLNLHVTIKDGESNQPISASIIVGNQFSWGSQQATYTYDAATKKGGYVTDGVGLKVPYGDLSFVVVPDDNVHYRTQTFKYFIKTPDYVGKITDYMSAGSAEFDMTPRKNRFTVCITDAITKQAIDGNVTITGIPDFINPALKPVAVKGGKCTDFSFSSNQPSYQVTVSSPGYANFSVTVQNNMDNENGAYKDVFAEMQPGISLAGVVKVDGKLVKNSVVYVKDLKNIIPVTTGNDGSYSIEGLPANDYVVNVVATNPGLKTIGQSKPITLSIKPAGGNNQLGGQVNGNLGLGLGNPVFSGVYDGIYTYSNQKAYTIKLNFDLQTNADLDLNNLYGFPLEVEALTNINSDWAYLTGRIKVPGNDVFKLKNQPYLHFTSIKIKRGINNAKVVPQISNVSVDDNNVDATLYGAYSVKLKGSGQGILVTSDGVVGATAILSSDDVAGNVKMANEVSLIPSKTKPTDNTIPSDSYQGPDTFSPVEHMTYIFKADKANVNIGPFFTFACSNGYGGNIFNGFHYTLNNMYPATAGGYIYYDGLHLNSVIHTYLAHVDQHDINLNIGEIQVTNYMMAPVSGKTPIDIPLDDWHIQSNDWSIGSGALTLNGNVKAGSITIPFTGMQVSEYTMDFASLKLENIGIAGVPVGIDPATTTTSFGYDAAAKYGSMYNYKYGCWSISMLPKTDGGTLAKIAKLPDLADGTVNIMNISLYSKGGESRIVLMPDHPVLRLNNMADFQPVEMENGDDYIRIHGALNFSIPGFTGTENLPYSLNYSSSGGVLVHKHQAIDGLKLTTNGIRVQFGTEGQDFTNNSLILKGTLQDKVTDGPYKLAVNFFGTAAIAAVTVDENAPNVVPFGDGQQMTKIKGDMTLVNNKWSNFKFEGDMTATGMEASKPTHMLFEVKGDMVVNKAEIGVKNVSVSDDASFGLVYDFDKKAVVGSLHLDNLSTPIGTVKADLEMLFGNGQWYILGAGVVKDLSMPLPVNGASAAFMIGNAEITDDLLQIIAPVFHNGTLPDDFDTNFKHLSGSLFVAGVDMKLPILPDIDFDVVLAALHLHYGVYVNAYLGLKFDLKDAKIIGGLKIGAYVNLTAGTSLGLVCAGISLYAEANMQATMVMDNLNFTDLNPISFYKASHLILTAGPQILLSGEAYIGAGICNGDCNPVKVLGVKIPPGCFKKNIGGDLNLSMKLGLDKASGDFFPGTASISAYLFGTQFNGSLDLPKP